MDFIEKVQLCVALVIIGVIIALLIAFGNTPVGELPTWVWWFLK